jgi:sugar lactone lactonase YvrE
MPRLALAIGLLIPAVLVRAEAPAEQPIKWLPTTAYLIPEDTHDGEGYFSIIPGKNGRLYVGTSYHGVNSFLVEFDPAIKQMKSVVDSHKAIGIAGKRFGAQSKIHTRNNVGESGKIYFATKQGYPGKDEKWEDYPGGHPIVYDPATGQAKAYPNPIPHHGIISITPDESRGIAYISTCADKQPESSHFMILNLKTGQYRDLMDCHHVFAFIVLDNKGRAYHPVHGGDIVRYDPATDKLERLKQAIDGMPPTAASHLADKESHPINWDISPDGKTLYSVAMSTNQLYSYDLTAPGDVLPGKSLGLLVPGAKDTDCRALCVGPKGEVWAAVTVTYPKIPRLSHLVRYRPGDKAPVDLGTFAITNPEFAPSKDKDGKAIPRRGGVIQTADGKSTTQYVLLGIAQAPDGAVYTLGLVPYMLLQVQPADQ